MKCERLARRLWGRPTGRKQGKGGGPPVCAYCCTILSCCSSTVASSLTWCGLLPVSCSCTMTASTISSLMPSRLTFLAGGGAAGVVDVAVVVVVVDLAAAAPDFVPPLASGPAAEDSGDEGADESPSTSMERRGWSPNVDSGGEGGGVWRSSNFATAPRGGDSCSRFGEGLESAGSDACDRFIFLFGGWGCS